MPWCAIPGVRVLLQLGSSRVKGLIGYRDPLACFFFNPANRYNGRLADSGGRRTLMLRESGVVRVSIFGKSTHTQKGNV